MKKFVGGCFIFIQRLIWWIFQLIFWGAVFYGLYYWAVTTNMVEVPLGIGLLIIIIGFYRIFIRPKRKKKKQVTVPATILRIDIPNNVSQPILYHTVVQFESRGKRIAITLTPEQVNDGFIDKNFAGDTGLLTYSGDRMYQWKTPTVAEPRVDARHKMVFISYAHEWADDAAYLAQLFQTEGLSVWHDRAKVRVGDQLTHEIEKAIRDSTYFVPLLSQDYWNSEWCIREFELAAKSNLKILPIKVSAGDLVMPPHIQRLYRDQLGEPIFLDMRGRNQASQLKDLARRMTQ